MQVAETFDRNPAGIKSRPVKAGNQPEASPARCRVTDDVKRGQRVNGPCDSASKDCLTAEADPVHRVEGNIDMPQLPGMKTPPGLRAWHVDMGSPGTWEL